MPLYFAASVRYLFHHPWQLALMLAGLALGVATITAVDLATGSARRALELSMDAVNGRATHQIVAGSRGVDEQLYVALRRSGAVRELTPVVEGYATIAGRSMQILGIDVLTDSGFRDSARDLTAAVERLTRWLVEPGAVMVARSTARELDLEIDAGIPIDVAGRRFTARLAATFDATRPGFEEIVVTDIAQAQEWLGLGRRLSRIDVRIVEDGTQAEQLAALRAELPPGVQVTLSGRRAQALIDMTAAFITNLRALSLLALLVSAFLVYNSMSFAVLQRRASIATLRALGVTRAQILGAVLLEAIFLGAIGALCGALLGRVLAGELLELVARTINDLYFVVAVTDVTPTWTAAPKALAVGLLAALVAAGVPALEAALSTPRLGLMRSALESRAVRTWQRLALCAIAFAGVATAMIAFSQRSLIAGFGALLLLMLAVALATPAVLRATARVSGRAIGRISTTARVAIAGVGASLSRTGVAVAALCIALAAALGVAVMVDSFRESLRLWLERTLRADIYVTAPGPGFSRPERQIDAEGIRRLLAVPGIVDHSASRRVSVESPDGPVFVEAVELAKASYGGITLLAGDPTRVWPAFERGGILLSESQAFRTARGAGGRVTLLTARGPRSFAVAGVYRDYGNDRGAVMMNRTIYRALWNDDAVTALGLYLAPGLTSGQIIPRLRASVADRQALLIRSNRDVRELSMAIFEHTFAITHVLYWLAAGIATLGLLSALLAYELERGREVALLRALGMTPRGVGALIAIQTGFVGLVTGLAALPAGLATAWILVEVINRRAFGWQLDLHVQARELAISLLLAVTAALAAGLYPAWRAARSSIAATIREE